MVFIIINIILSIIFFVNELDKIKIYIYDKTEKYLIYLRHNNTNNITKESPVKKDKNKNKKNISETVKSNIKKNKKGKEKQNINIKNNKIKNLNIMISINKNSILKTNNKKNSLNLNSKTRDSLINNTSILKSNSSKINLKTQNKYKNILNKKIPNNSFSYFNKYFSKSPDEMYFDDAIILDKRTLLEFFCDTLKDNQIILNTFYSYEPFKPRAIKIIIFILNIFLYFVVNALFINDDYISEVYYLEKQDNFFSFIPRSINRFFYTTLVGIIIEFIVDFFFVEEKKMKGIFLREKDNKIILKNQIINLVDLIKKKYISFIIFVFIIYVICLYYLICFYSIYPKIQVEWIKSSIFIFIIRQIVSILQCFLETILRFISFKCGSEKIYKISKLIN